MAASIALLCGPAGSVALPACRQILSDDGRFRYLGGSTPLAPALHSRAATLAQRALCALPTARGYVGFDLVLGEAEDGSQDVVIEVNPRLTTSYVGVRAATEVNVAGLLLQAAHSRLHVGWLQQEAKAK
jgi:predicted ATP-grasp superfamily ATP-dependent carboligase